MPVIVPILRVGLLFLNVYDTFKILKLPQRSARTGKRTVQAMSQRKRNMKGCMCVWLVWCASIFLERILDNAIGIFMPFYNELKAVVFLFQLLTRTKGAEPIYIHVLRPLIKPYVATLDYSLDLLHGFGDFMMLVLSLPYHMVLDWWHPKQRHLVNSDTSDSNQDEPLDAVPPPNTVETNGNANFVGVRTRRSRQMARPQNNAVAGPSRSTSRTTNIVPSKSDPSVKRSVYEVWYPPELSRNEDSSAQTRRVVSDSASVIPPADVRNFHPTAVIPQREDQLSTGDDPDQEDWRAYPPFPSAYPPTPLSRNKQLSTSSSGAEVNGSSVGLEPIGEQSDAVIADMEEWRKYEPFPSAYPHTPEVKTRSVPVLPSAARVSSLDPVVEKDGNEDVVPLNSVPPVDEYGVLIDNTSQGAPARPKATTTQSLPTRTGLRSRGDRLDPLTRHPRVLQPGQPPRPRNDGRDQDFRRVARVAA